MPLHHQFIRVAKEHKKKAALIDRSTGRNVSYSKALIASLILAKKFNQYKPGFLGIMIPTSAGCALSILGTLISGRVPVMINYSTGAAENARFAQEKCGFRTIITSKALLEKIGCRPIDGMVFIEDIMETISALEKIKAAAKSMLPTRLLLQTVYGGDEDDNAVILFTSGSEKEPKAVQLTHRNIASNIADLSRVFKVSAEDRFLASLPFFHVFGLTAGLWVPLFHGMTIVTYANPLDFKVIPGIARDDRVTMMVGTPSFFWGYLQKSNPGDFKTVRIAVVGADKCPEALREAWLQRHGTPLLEAYGATETSPGISVNTPQANRPGSVGKALPGIEVRIEHLETGEPLPAGRTGKVLVKGDSVMKGYLGDIEETSVRIHNGWYDTGDMGYLDTDGYLWLEGRLKRFVKIGGEMVSLVRVEDTLAGLLPPGAYCCVVGSPDPVKGARIVAVTTQTVDEKDILRRLAEHLPPIAVPRKFMVIEELPMMGSGKVDFRSVGDLVNSQVV